MHRFTCKKIKGNKIEVEKNKTEQKMICIQKLEIRITE